MVLMNVSKLGEKGYKTYKKHVCGNARFRFGKCLPCPQMFGCRALLFVTGDAEVVPGFADGQKKPKMQKRPHSQ